MSLRTLSTIVAAISLAVSGAEVIAQNGYTPVKKTNLVAYPKRVLPGGVVSLIAKLTEGNQPAEGVTVRFYMDGNEIPYIVPYVAPKTNSDGIAEAGVPVTASAGATVKFVAKPANSFPQSNEESVVVVGGIWKEDPNHLYQGFDVLDAGLWDIGEYPWTVVGIGKTTQAAMLSLEAVPDPNVPIIIVSAIPATATITPPNTGQQETNTPVTGVAAGETHATAGNPEIARLKLLVKDKIEYTVNFHYAKDGNATPHETSRTNQGEAAILSALANAWTNQSNVKFTTGTSGQLLLNGNWGDVIPANRINELYSKVSPGQGQIAIIFVWACDISKGGVTEGNKCIIKDSASDLVIAHEVGHAMGLTQDSVDCDYPGSDLHSSDVMCKTVMAPRVRQFQTQTIHAKYPTGPPKE